MKAYYTPRSSQRFVIACVGALVATAAWSSQAAAANYYVRPGATGSGSGEDWANAFSSLPASLARGDTYYLADGTYGHYTFDDANSGTSTITLKKATESDHGTSTGWNSSYGDGQATFSEISIYTDYYVFDGQRRNADWWTGAVSQYGIRIKGTGAKVVRLDNGSGQGADNLTLRYVDMEGSGRGSGRSDDIIYGLASNSNLTIQYCAMHDVDRVMFLVISNAQNWLVEQSYMARNTSTPAVHGELMSSMASRNITFRNNFIDDIQGTAVWAFINGGDATDWYVYGNVITGGSYAATIFVTNDPTQRNTLSGLRFFNNTLIKAGGLWSGLHIEAGSNNEARNNIWYDSVRTNSNAATLSHNWYFNTIADGDDSSTKVVCTSNCNLFKSLSEKDFRLTQATPQGLDVGSRYSLDPDGRNRGTDGVWDRGAFEFGTAQNKTPNPPTDLTVESP